jgi:O-antigen ligase
MARHGRRTLLWWGCVSILMVGAAVSISRTGMLGIAIVGIGLLWRIGLLNWLATTFVALLVTALFGLLEPRLLAVLTKTVTGSGRDSSVQARLTDYDYVYQQLLRWPMAGQGFGTYQAPPQPFLDNQYLLTTVESGLVGLAALVTLLVVPMVLMTEVWRGRGVISTRREEFPEVRDAAWAIGCGLAICVVSFGTFDALAFPQFEGFLFLMIGLAGAVAAQAFPGRPVGARTMIVDPDRG